jgi:peptide/nickel transport system ATP-binding protein/oligopeptide transport system ATP-binding protein
VIDRCRTETPELVAAVPGQAVACHRVSELPEFAVAVGANGSRSPTLDRLTAAFTAASEVRAAAGVRKVSSVATAAGPKT